MGSTSDRRLRHRLLLAVVSQALPIDALKIDRSFVTDVTSNLDDAAIATAIILMGHSLKLSVVAEGVETENQLRS